MDAELTSLAAGCIAFVGSHFVLSHPLRAPLVRIAGEMGFMALYSLVSFATLGWAIWAFRGLGPGGAMLWDGNAPAPWLAASALTLIAITLLAGSLRGNPALPMTPGEVVAKARASGVFVVTRHPMMWGIALWALAHILVAPSARVIVLAGAMAVLALVGARLQDGKKALLLGPAWAQWSAQTSYWPRLGRLGEVPLATWALGFVLWLVATYGHLAANHVAAGIWRWVI